MVTIKPFMLNLNYGFLFQYTSYKPETYLETKDTKFNF